MKNILLITAFLFAGTFVKAQLITRGTQPGEIYLSRNWFLNSQNKIVYVVMRSTDNGEHLSLQYSSTEFPPQGTGLTIVSDATPGVLYGYANDSLYITTNYGQTWHAVEKCIYEILGKYFSGNSSGKIYKTIVNQALKRIELYESINSGSEFLLINDTVFSYFGEVGTENNEIYLNRYSYLGDSHKVYFSSNNGQYFTLQCQLDTSIAGYNLSGNNTMISRGAVAGELYLVSWHSPAHYRIYYSNDYGQTFELKYQSCYYELYSCGFHFTAGRQPGSFYVMRNTGTFEPYFHSQVYIDYSSDYAETFTTYFHDLDSNYVFYDGINNFEHKQTACYNFPNPFTDITTISYEVAEPATVVINIYSITGQKLMSLVNEEKAKGKYSVEVNASNLPKGIYLYTLELDGKVMEKDKMVLTK